RPGRRAARSRRRVSLFRWPDARRDRGRSQRHGSNRGTRLGKGPRAASRFARGLSDSPKSSRRPMTRERWERLAPLIDAALDQPPERRAAYVAETCDDDAALAEELTRFLSAYDDQRNETPAGSIFAAAYDERSALMSERLRDSANSLRVKLEESLG